MIVLSIAALWSFLREPERGWASDAGRVTVAAAGGGAIVGAGLLSMLVGPAKLRVDTSKDAFLRRTGLESLLANTYRERFNENIRRYASWALLPLAAAGIPRVHGFTRRFLVAWALLTIVGVPIGIWSGWFPPDRIITFGFALPVLAALGIAWADGFLEARVPLWIAWPATAALILLLAWPTLGAWARQQPFISPEDLASATEVGRIAATTPPGTPIVVIVNDIDDTAIFLATQAGNILRAAVPPERAGDVYIYVGDPARYFAGEPTLRGNAEYDALSSQLLDDIPAGDAAVFVLDQFDRVGGTDRDPHFVRWSSDVVSTVRDPRALPPGDGELIAAAPMAIAGATLLVAVFLWALGYGWARWTFGDAVTAAAAAPGFGVAALAIVGLLAERLGVPLTGSWGPTLDLTRGRRARVRTPGPQGRTPHGTGRVGRRAPTRRARASRASRPSARATGSRRTPSGYRSGSVVHCAIARAAPEPKIATRGACGRSHTSGSAHVTYQGNRSGPSSISSTSDHPIAAPGVRGRGSTASRATIRPSAISAATRAAAKTSFASPPSVPKLTMSTTRRASVAGASHPSCFASSSMPSDGSSGWR